MKETAILINTRDRPSELGLLLQSLRTQTYQNFDIFVLDDFGGTPLTNFHFLNCLINLLKMEGHQISFKRTNFPHGVSRARQEIVNWAKGYELFCRVDDDVILEPEYLNKLRIVLSEGYDLASGVTVPCSPFIRRDPKYLNGKINRVIINDEGKLIYNGDDCGMPYIDSIVLPADHFRSCALYKSVVHDKVNYLPNKLSNHGFREEQIFSFRLIMEGYNIGVDTGALNYHQMTPSGGERFHNQVDLTQFNQKAFEEFTRKNKNKLKKYFNTKIDSEELNKCTNLI